MDFPPTGSRAPEPTAARIHPESGAPQWLLRFDPAAFEITPEAVARYFGGSRYRITDKNRDRIEAAIHQGRRFIQPQAVIARHSLGSTAEPESIRLPDGTLLAAPCAATDATIREISTAIATLGPGLEDACRKMADSGEIYAATLLDAVGITLLESLADACRVWLFNTARQDEYHWGGQLSPGTRHCPIEHQSALFGMVDAAAVGVQLMPSLVMDPVKSISAFYLLTDRPVAGAQGYKCSRCDMKHCQFRQSAAHGASA